MGEEQNLSICEEVNFRKIYNHQSIALRNFMYYKCGSLAKAEDLMHEAFVKLWDNCSSVVFEKAKSFIFTVANRLFLNDYHHQKVVLNFEKRTTTLENQQNPQFIMEEQEFKKRLENAISALSDNQKEVFLMNRIDKLSYREIAELLDISVKAVEKRMHLALIKLKNMVEELEHHKF